MPYVRFEPVHRNAMVMLGWHLGLKTDGHVNRMFLLIAVKVAIKTNSSVMVPHVNILCSQNLSFTELNTFEVFSRTITTFHLDISLQKNFQVETPSLLHEPASTGKRLLWFGKILWICLPDFKYFCKISCDLRVRTPKYWFFCDFWKRLLRVIE